MTQRRWKLVVTELGSTAGSLHEVVVDAGDWMTALTRARGQIGERGGVPPGASCAVAPDGKVTILDGVARRQYALAPTEDAPSAPAPAPAAAAPAAPATPKKVAKHTVAYMVSPLAAPGSPPAAVPVGANPPSAAPSSAPPPSAAPPSATPPSAAPAAGPAPSVPKPASVPPPSSVIPRPASVPPPSSAAAPSAASASTTGAAPAKKVAKHTVAYLPGAAEIAALAAAQTAAQATAAPTTAAQAAAPPQAAAGAAAIASAPSAPPPQPLAAFPPSAPSQPPVAPRASQPPPDGAELLYARDAEPSPETPLVYRERTFVVALGTSADDAEALLRRLFADLREELASRPKGKLVNLAVFDHSWEGRPERPPLAVLQWKDWRGEPEIQRPSAAGAPAATPSHPPAPAAPSVPPPHSQPPAVAARPSTPAAAPAPASTPAPAGRARTTTPSPDERLTQAFEALQDLFFLGSPLEGADFVLNLLADLVPCEASSVCLYDINTDELRFVALRGPGADERKGEAIPPGAGLIGAAANGYAQPLLLEAPRADERFDAGVDGRVGLDVGTLALAPVFHQGRLQGVIQLVNRHGQPQFVKADANVLGYVAEKLGEFLHQTRLSETRPRR